MPKGYKTGGRQKGSLNKKTLWLHAQLMDHGCNLFLKLAEAINREDTKMIIALTPIIQYISPKPLAQADIVGTEPLRLSLVEVQALVEAVK